MSPNKEASGTSGAAWFQRFKYAVYGLLTINVFLFLQEDFSAGQSTFGDGLTLETAIEVFAATIDTAAWVVLLFLFELETYVIADDKIKGLLKWSLHGVRAVCYIFILYAFYGYGAKAIIMYSFVPFTVDDVCALANSTFTIVELLDEYPLLTTENCGALVGADLFKLPNQDFIASREGLDLAISLAWTDIINAGTWILVVILLEIDVMLQLRDTFTGGALLMSKLAKVALYGTLFGAAVYWWYYGNFLDFWDAFLWLVAFVFIELNLFEWQAETQEEKSA